MKKDEDISQKANNVINENFQKLRDNIFLDC